MMSKEMLQVAEAIAQERMATRVLDRKAESDRLDAIATLAYNIAGRWRNLGEGFDHDEFLSLSEVVTP